LGQKIRTSDLENLFRPIETAKFDAYSTTKDVLKHNWGKVVLKFSPSKEKSASSTARISCGILQIGCGSVNEFS
jgi:hypothetical protein